MGVDAATYTGGPNREQRKYDEMEAQLRVNGYLKGSGAARAKRGATNFSHPKKMAKVRGVENPTEIINQIIAKANPNAAKVQQNMEMRAAMGGPPQVPGVRYTDVPIPQRGGGGQFQLGGADPGNIPGFGAVNIKMHSPTQAEQVLAGMGTSPVQLSDVKAGLLEEKGFRNAEALERVRFAQEMLEQGGSPSSLFDAVDVLNSTNDGGRSILEDKMNDSIRVANLREKQENRGFQRGTESPDFVGEGQFGRVDRIAPGYVEKRQAPVSEWYKGDGEGGTATYLVDARDVKAEVDQLNQLERLGITPKVEAFHINPDGSTEVVMRDLTQNFEPGEQVFESIGNDLQNSSNPEGVRMAGDRLRKISIARNQQEAMAAAKGIELKDRHPGNFMVNKLTDRPIQIDPSGQAISGIKRDNVMGTKSVQAMQAAGLHEEAGILEGLLNEAFENFDDAMFKDLAQQGMSRAMKLKRGVDENYFVANPAMVMPQND